MFFHWIWHLTYINEWNHAKFQFWAPEINFWSKNSIFSPKNKLSAQHIWCLKFNWYIILCTLCIEMYELMHNNSPAKFFSQKINFSPKSQFLAPKINFCPKNKFLIKKFPIIFVISIICILKVIWSQRVPNLGEFGQI